MDVQNGVGEQMKTTVYSPEMPKYKDLKHIDSGDLLLKTFKDQFLVKSY